MKIKVTILGSQGMLGHMLFHYLKEQDKYELIPLSRKDIDLKNKFDCINLCEFLQDKNIDYIINCMGVLVKQSDFDYDMAQLINTELPHLLESSFKDTYTQIIHISTDCVFNGNKPYPQTYNEFDVPDETNNYGLSKSLGEIENKKDLTIRTSIISIELKNNGTGLFEWFMKQKDECFGYINHYWNGLTCLELSKIIEKIIKIDNSKIYGIKHIYTLEKVISKYELLCLIDEVFNKKIKIIPLKNEKTINKSLCSNKIQNIEIFREILSYRDQLKELKKWIINHPNLYKNKKF
jgi:dTDP-4-dehydrorhamnose reductase